MEECTCVLEYIHFLMSCDKSLSFTVYISMYKYICARNKPLAMNVLWPFLLSFTVWAVYWYFSFFHIRTVKGAESNIFT